MHSFAQTKGCNPSDGNFHLAYLRREQISVMSCTRLGVSTSVNWWVFKKSSTRCLRSWSNSGGRSLGTEKKGCLLNYQKNIGKKTKVLVTSGIKDSNLKRSHFDEYPCTPGIGGWICMWLITPWKAWQENSRLQPPIAQCHSPRFGSNNFCKLRSQTLHFRNKLPEMPGKSEEINHLRTRNGSLSPWHDT